MKTSLGEGSWKIEMGMVQKMQEIRYSGLGKLTMRYHTS